MSFLRRHYDVVLAVVLALIICAELLAWGRTTNLPAALGAAAVAAASLIARRRAPLAAFLMCMVALDVTLRFGNHFDNDSLGLVAIYYVALWSLGRWSRGIQAWLAVPAIVYAVVDFLMDDMGTGLDLGDLAFTLAFVGGPWAAGLIVRLRQERETHLKAENLRLEREQQEVARRAVAEERARLARELHDVVSHAISVTVLQARGARRTLGVDDEQVRQALDAIEHTNTAALSDMRRLLAVLRDTEGEPEGERQPQPSLAHLDRLVAHVRDSGLPVELEVRGSAGDVPPGVDLSAYRIVQEALTNALKHAGRATAEVLLSYGDDALSVSVRDTGTGSGDGGGSGHGLIGIRERVAVVGGEVTAGPVPEGGFLVSARLPYSLEIA